MRYQLRFKGFLLAAILVVSSSAVAFADTVRRVEAPRDALASTAAIIEGTVRENTYTFDRMAGPRTVAPLIDVVADFGRFSDRTVELATLGGPFSSSQELLIPELPRLTDGTRYLVFLTNADWFFSPVVENYVFRLEIDPRRGTEVLIAPSGHVVTGLTEEGLEFTEEPAVDTQVDFSRPNVRLPLVEGAPALLASGMSKTDFLVAVRTLLASAPLQGEFHSTPARDRVWNQITTSEAPRR